LHDTDDTGAADGDTAGVSVVDAGCSRTGDGVGLGVGLAVGVAVGLGVGGSVVDAGCSCTGGGVGLGVGLGVGDVVGDGEGGRVGDKVVADVLHTHRSSSVPVTLQSLTRVALFR
jgi:hypothetical protein